ncbi:MAG: DEAD/DEAH box helicase family protein [Saprospiraceae bacterium]|nr:DEAD/DEAH box helicase family protein [Saprospiraceae bacterium]
MNLSKITPEYLDSYVCFYYNQPNWHYNKNLPLSMPKIQVEGTAKLWNLLQDYHIALLADEVGMGKTIQALGVLATLWRQKPEAKVLLYAPNENVALKWVNEYDNFFRYHYRNSDDLNKSSLTHEPLRLPVYCDSHKSLLLASKNVANSFFVCKTSSLSNFASNKIDQSILDLMGFKLNANFDREDEDELIKFMVNLALKSNQHFYNEFSKDDLPPFDLLIFDEAHYLRNAEGDSNRTLVANALFSGQTERSSSIQAITKDVLLLTATPNHTSPDNIKSIISIFDKAISKKTAEEILNLICVRRFRRLQGKTKYEYRDEIPNGIKMRTLQEKLFFAFYQKSLVKHHADMEEEKKRRQDYVPDKRHNPYRILYGYLEGFEFLPLKEEKQKKNTQEKSGNGDFRDHYDADIIRELGKKFRSVYQSPPHHPKYDDIIEKLKPQTGTDVVKLEKKLIFVRRIASVTEISRRAIDEYDLWLWEILKKELVGQKPKLKNIRQYFWSLGKNEEEIKEDQQSESEFVLPIKPEKKDRFLDDSIPESKILHLFTKLQDKENKKNVRFGTTDCSNFRQRFLVNVQLFSIFFSPALDYKMKSYRLSKLYKISGKRIYKTSGHFERVNYIKDNYTQQKVRSALELNDEPGEYFESILKSFPTLMTIWYKLALKTQTENTSQFNALTEYDSWSEVEKEGFSTYLETGIIFSSPFIVHFYAYYRRIQKGKKKFGEELYSDFCQLVEENMERIGLLDLISNAINTFKIFYKKELALTEKKLSAKNNWNFLKATLPVYPCSGKTKRRAIIQAFNTPFFPYSLIATSVLQEGVDLHYHCSEVIHYGIAWTQGDNEQRVGRVDRMFGKLDNELRINEKAILPIHYPFLANTIDEDQMCRYINRKYQSDKLIDNFKNIKNPNDINFLDDVDKSNWLLFFRKHEIGYKIEEPFNVDIKTDFNFDSSLITIEKPKGNFNKLVHPILTTLKSHYKNEFVSFLQKNEITEHDICGVKHIRKNGRHQPLLVNINYLQEGMTFINKPVYVLSIKTPIYSHVREKYDDLRKFGKLKDIYKDNPLLKICRKDKDRDWYPQYISAEMPLFLIRENDCNISKDELICIADLLLNFADDLEEQFLYKKDIPNEEVINRKSEDFKLIQNGLGENRFSSPISSRWLNNVSNDYIYKAIENKCEVIEGYKYNAEHRLVRQIFIDQKTSYLEVGVYKNDALDEEKELLEKILTNQYDMYCSHQ